MSKNYPKIKVSGATFQMSKMHSKYWVIFAWFKSNRVMGKNTRLVVKYLPGKIQSCREYSLMSSSWHFYLLGNFYPRKECEMSNLYSFKCQIELENMYNCSFHNPSRG